MKETKKVAKKRAKKKTGKTVTEDRMVEVRPDVPGALRYLLTAYDRYGKVIGTTFAFLPVADVNDYRMSSHTMTILEPLVQRGVPS